MDVLEHSELAHAEYVLDGLNRFRNFDPKLCDFSIRVGQIQLACHRSVLCLFSSFFEGAIRGGYRESFQDFVVLQDTPSSDVEAILEFMYTGHLTLNQSNVESLLKTSTKLGVSKIVNLCLEYLRHQIDQSNCLDILKLARESNHQVLEASARQYLNDNLCSVFQQEFPKHEIEPNEVISLLQDPHTHEGGEEAVVLTVMTWLQTDLKRRRDHASHLLNHVIWRKLPAPFLLKVLLRHPLLSLDSQIKSLVLERVRHSYDERNSPDVVETLFSCQGNTSANSNGSRLNNDEKRSLGPLGILSNSDAQPGLVPHHALFLVGGLSLGEAERGDTSQANVMCYHPVNRMWRKRASWPERGLRGFSVCKFNNNVTVTGGCATSVNKHIVIKRAWLYLVVTNKWRQLPDMIKSRAFHSTCQLHSQLYSVGGSSGNELDVEVFDQHHSTWKKLRKPAPRMMYNFTASSCNGKLIIIGSGLVSTVFLQCYNPAVDTWTVIRSPNVPRHLSSPVCVTSIDETKIFVSGDNTKKVVAGLQLYIFDPNNNSWSRAADMNNLHSNGNLMMLGEEVIHTGGHWEEDGYWDEMESYEMSSNVWHPLGPLPHLWLYHGCVSIYVDQ